MQFNDNFQKSIFENIEGQTVNCGHQVFDFYAGDGNGADAKDGDFRLIQCTELNQASFLDSYGEMAGIQYAMQYAHQPLIFREAAAPGFNSAVGEAIIKSVDTPAYYQSGNCQMTENSNKIFV
jgi:peptidyl-dipeptidase A